MQDILFIINDLLVEAFYDVLTIEENALKNGSFYDVSIKEVHTVEAIGLHQVKTMSEVAGILNITMGTLSVAVNNLVKKGYVERLKDNADKRVVNLRLSNRGRLLYRIHAQFHRHMVQEVVSSFSEQEKEVLQTALSKLDRFLKGKYSELGVK